MARGLFKDSFTGAVLSGVLVRARLAIEKGSLGRDLSAWEVDNLRTRKRPSGAADPDVFVALQVASVCSFTSRRGQEVRARHVVVEFVEGDGALDKRYVQQV